MRITVRQLKGLIRESIAEAMVGAGEVNPRTQAMIAKIAKENSPFLSVEDPATVLHDIAIIVDRKFHGKNTLAYVDMVVNAMKKHVDDVDFDALKEAVPEFQEEWKKYAAEGQSAF